MAPKTLILTLVVSVAAVVLGDMILRAMRDN